MRQYLRQEVYQANALNVQLEAYWDNKLRHRFALAPKDLVRSGQVNRENYRTENQKFGRTVSDLMLAEVVGLPRPKVVAHNRYRIAVLGAGLARDLAWVKNALEYGYRVDVYDVSNMALDNLHKIGEFGGLIEHEHLQTIAGEIEDSYGIDGLGSVEYVAYFASQFIQVLPEDKMQRLLSELGKGMVRTSVPRGYPKVCLVHPLPEDNTSSSAWYDSRLYSLEAISQGFITGLVECGRQPNIRQLVVSKVSYYHQVYSFILVTLDS